MMQKPPAPPSIARKPAPRPPAPPVQAAEPEVVATPPAPPVQEAEPEVVATPPAAPAPKRKRQAASPPPMVVVTEEAPSQEISFTVQLNEELPPLIDNHEVVSEKVTLPAGSSVQVHDAHFAYNEELPKSEPGKIRFDPGSGEELPEQVSSRAAAGMNVMERFALWRKINRQLTSNSFAPIIRHADLPRKMQIEKPVGEAPVVEEGTVYWCCYCGEWNVFETFTYLGSDRCVGCGISTKDYYNRTANKLWTKEL